MGAKVNHHSTELPFTWLKSLVPHPEVKDISKGDLHCWESLASEQAFQVAECAQETTGK